MTFDPFSVGPPTKSWGVNFGGGVNSKALLLLLHSRGLRPDWVLFADTGSERPETYAGISPVADWCQSVGFPFQVVKWIRRDGTFESVHANALRSTYLPSKAYGYSGCTYKWKIQPMAKWRKENGFADSVVGIGYDAGEKKRIAKAKAACQDAELDPSLAEVWYPLVAWGIDRNICEGLVKAQGWDIAKSSCFLCPHMRGAEWESLRQEHPDLFQIALDVEAGAKKAGHADSVSLFKRAKGTCLCLADGCTTSETK